MSDVVYPPTDPGLPVEAAAVLLADQDELMSMLRLHAATSPARFEERFEGPLWRVAEYVNLLPGSPNAAFSGAGGLFRACCETAFSAFRASDGRIFTGEMGVEDRHKLEGRWRYVCFLGGMLYPIGASLAAMSVINNRGQRWACELDSLHEWAVSSEAERVYVTWLDKLAAPGPSPATGTLALRLIGRPNIEWLNEGSPQLISSLVDIVTDSSASRKLIAAGLIKDMWTAVHEREQGRRPQNFGQLSIGSDIAPYLLDAMVALVRSKWKMNKSIVYADAAGVYLKWPEAGRDIIDFCRDKSYPGVPSTDAALLAILVSTRIIVAEFDGVALMQIADHEGEIASAVKLAKPAVVLGIDQSLETIAASRPVAMNAVRAADPLAQKVNGPSATVNQVQSGERTTKADKPQPAAQPPRAPPTLDLLDPAEVLQGELAASATPDHDVSEPASPAAAPATEAAPRAPRTTPKPSPPAPRAPGAAKGKALVEGAEIRFASFLPPEVAEGMPKYYAEVLGRLVHTWRNKSGGEWLMRMCEHGAAYEIKLLAEFTNDVPAFLSALGERGMLFTSPATPAKMIYPVATVEGGQKTATCFILAQHTVRRLALS